MEGFVLSRIGKPAIMFVITFFAVRYITGNTSTALALALIPAVLGGINISAGFGYSLAAFSVVAAVVVAVTPQFIKQPITAMAMDAIHQSLPQSAGASQTLPQGSGASKTTETTRTVQTASNRKS